MHRPKSETGRIVFVQEIERGAAKRVCISPISFGFLS
uniref:Uncharacterized protein n=1 Tax=Ascaris lumbricoides TaxID=6252 RepID=A0A0M3IB26_ASCLU